MDRKENRLEREKSLLNVELRHSTTELLKPLAPTSIEIVATTPTDPDFISLVKELNHILNSITQDTGESSFLAQSFDTISDGCLVVYQHAQPVACGIIRYYSATECEVKRMYSKRSGIGRYLLEKLEFIASEKGYQHAILSTRRVNIQAVQFYLRNGYTETSGYGRYTGVNRSICFRKSLI